jgi:hypothetical protein
MNYAAGKRIDSSEVKAGNQVNWGRNGLMSTGRKVWLWVPIILSGLGGLQNVFAPAMAPTPWGTLGDAGLELLRFVGILQISIAVISFAALKVTSADGRRAIDLFMFVGYGLGAVYSIYEVVVGTSSALMWVQTVIAGVVACAFGYYLFSARGAQAGQDLAKRAAGQ